MISMNAPVSRGAKATLLVTSMLTVMAGATIAPALPAMEDHFIAIPNAAILVRLVLTIPALAVAIGAPLIGAAVDRFGRKRILIASALLYALGGVSGAFLETLPAILAGRVLLGLAVAGVMTGTTAMIADVFEGEGRASFLGMQSAFMAFGGILFLPLGGFLAEIGWRAPFFVYLLSLALVPAILVTLPDPRPGQASAAVSGWRGLPWTLLAPLFLGALTSMVVFYLMPVQFPFHLRDMLGGGPSQVGLALGGMTLVGGITSTQYGRLRRRWGHRQILVGGLVLFGLGLEMIGLSQRYLGIGIGLVMLGLSLGALMPNFTLWTSVSVPANARGRALGGLTVAFFLGQFLSPIVSQPSIERFGFANTWYLGGSTLLVLAAVLWHWTRAVGSGGEAVPRRGHGRKD